MPARSTVFRMVVSESFIQTWFALQHQLIAGLQLAYIDLHGRSVPSGAMVVTYPEVIDNAAELALAAQLAQRSKSPVTNMIATGDDGVTTLRIAYPLQLDRHADGAVVVEVLAPLERQAALLQLLKWGEAWLNLALSQQGSSVAPHDYAELLDAGLGQAGYRDTLAAVLSLLPGYVGCTRVALGRAHGDEMLLEAVSDVAELDPRSRRARSLEQAMREALQAASGVCWPVDDSDGQMLVMQHQLVDDGALNGVCSVPLSDGIRSPLVFVFEFAGDQRLSGDGRAACEEAARVVAPLLELRHALDRSWWRRFVELFRDGARQLGGTRGRHRRIGTLVAGLLLGLFAFSDGDYRVAAPASLEGALQRAVVAPFDGYIVEAPARAGQRVAEGESLARLDDRELIGERRRLRAEQAEFAEQHRQAVATLDHAKTKVLEAQLAQNEARLGLVGDQLRRTELRAPLAGLVISGDWRRSLGVPVSRGELLFQLAPLDEYRVAMQVSDRDIAGFESGLSGELTLTALPREVIRFEVTDISSLAPVEAAEPSFRVEARLLDALAGLRPGMQGVAKVSIGPRPRWWIWTHALTDWLRLQAWRLWP